MTKKDPLRLLSDPDLIPLPLQDLIRYVAAQAAALDMPCYLVGGLVRDILLNRAVNDFDVVVEGNAIKLGKAVVKELGGKLTSHTAFKTATWYLPSPIDGLSFLDLITARSETYDHPGALPTVKPSTIADDLHRRDFTINAMALRLDGEHFGELLDPLTGQEDLERGLIRVLHLRSFLDDPTRMLRAVRYEKRYGFQIEPGTLGLFNAEARKVLSQLSGERLRHEFDLMFGESSPETMLAGCGEMDLLQPIHPALKWNDKIRERFSRLSESWVGEHIFWAVWLLDLPPEEIRSLGKRLHFTAETIKCAVAASSIYHEMESLMEFRPSQLVERFDRMPEDAVSAVAASTSYGKSRVMLESYLAKWKHMQPTITGDDLKARGIPPGPKYKEILSRLRAAWIDGDVETGEQEQHLLESLFEEK